MAPIVDAGGFGPVRGSESPGGCSPTLLVTGADRAPVTRALRRVAPRLTGVVADGRELSPEELERAAEDELWNVNYASDPVQYVRGVGLWVDFKGADLPPEMGAAYRAIVHEELAREGVTDARLRASTQEDVETADEGMFASAGVRSVPFSRLPGLEPLLRALFEHLLGDALVLTGSPYAPDAVRDFLAAHDRRDESPLAWLTDSPAFGLDGATTAAFWQAANAAGESPFELLGLPLWVVRGTDVLAYVASAAHVRVRADLDPTALDALSALLPRRAEDEFSAGFDLRSDVLADKEAAKRLAKIKPELQPEQDWWSSAWRTWEPIPPAPGPPPPFDVFETAARIRASVDIWATSGHQYWHWRRAPFGPTVSSDEATAMLLLQQMTSWVTSTRKAAMMMTRYRPRELPFEQACRLAAHAHLPPAARLAALVAVGGAERTTEWLFGLPPQFHSSHAEIAAGFRAAVLPHLDDDRQRALSDTVREECETRPWTEGRKPPHMAFLLVGQLGLHDVCAGILANPDVWGTHATPLLVHGLGSPEEVVAAHRRLPNRFFEPWHGYAWLEVTGLDGIPELFEGIRPQHGWAEERMAPLLRLSDPAVAPYMEALLGTSVDKHARRWLKLHAGEAGR